MALALLVAATSIASAQSQRNFGPNGPSRFDCYGEPYSGTVASHCPGEGGYGPHWRYWRHYYRQFTEAKATIAAAFAVCI